MLAEFEQQLKDALKVDVELKEPPQGKPFKIKIPNPIALVPIVIGSIKNKIFGDQSDQLVNSIIDECEEKLLNTSFIINSTKYWRDTTLCFKGNSAQLFYQDLKFKKLDWTVFDLDSTNLGRIDVCYDRKLNSTDRYPHLFLENTIT